jgi:1D-myo-inositol 3-kinase
MHPIRVPAHAPTIVVAGHVTRDGGGPALCAARRYRELGAEARLVTAVGTDFARPDALAAVDTEVRVDGVSTVLDGDARWVARAQPVLAVDLPEGWRSCDLLHLAPMLGEVDLGRWAQVARARLVAISVRGFVRVPAPDGAIAAHDPWLDRRALAPVGAACVDDGELAARPGLLGQLVGAVPIVAVVRRRGGASVLVRGRETTVDAPAARDREAAEATFAAVFFHGLATGRAPGDAAEIAVRAGLVSVDELDSVPAVLPGFRGLGRRVS